MRLIVHPTWSGVQQLMQRVLGAAGDKYRDFFDDPNKMLQMILAAESMRSGGGGGGGNPATVQIIIQGTSGSAPVNLGTVTVTVP